MQNNENDGIASKSLKLECWPGQHQPRDIHTSQDCLPSMDVHAAFACAALPALPIRMLLVSAVGSVCFAHFSCFARDTVRVARPTFAFTWRAHIFVTRPPSLRWNNGLSHFCQFETATHCSANIHRTRLARAGAHTRMPYSHPKIVKYAFVK